ncbi:DUF4097 family beta strand repeat-containing protein [Streptomyces oceani]|uniref:DUF4097 family beta strand repeat-containing protein n=1 Tax=Streptomyces oceani TaxID=1075402 RepID=UPI0008723FCB|nr:DUF4097 family beta strand repeat-containing protein [Streptomyces oceani]
MPDCSWEIPQPRTLEVEDPVGELDVRLVNGAVNVVGTDQPTVRIEVSELSGPPLRLSRTGTKLVVAYDDLPGRGFLRWLGRRFRHHTAVVSVSVPRATKLRVGVVGASVMISGTHGSVHTRSVCGSSTLVGLAGHTWADTVSGSVETQGLRGELSASLVSGDLTVVEGGASAVTAESVSGSMVLDLEPRAETGVDLSTVSGEVALRVPRSADARVRVRTTSGSLSSAFDEVSVRRKPGVGEATGVLGSGGGSLRATSVSGAIALLCRPARAGAGVGLGDVPATGATTAAGGV